ncbi:hypothetical protein ABMX48_36330 [Streptomyces cavourensis]
MAALKEQKEDLHRVYVLEDEHEAAVVQAAQAQQRYEQLVALASSLVCFGCFELPCAVLLVLQSVGHLLERQPQLLVALLRLRGLDDGRFVLVFQDIDAVEVLLLFFERRHVHPVKMRLYVVGEFSTVGKEFLQILALQVSIPFRHLREVPLALYRARGRSFRWGPTDKFGNAQEGRICFQMRKKGSADG